MSIQAPLLPLVRRLGLACLACAVLATAVRADPPHAGPGTGLPTLDWAAVPAGALPNPFTALMAQLPAPVASPSGFVPSQMQGSLSGAPGLWNTQFAETLQAGQVSGGAYAQRYSRTPGGMVFTEGETGVTVGVTNWLEYTLSAVPYRRIRTTHPEQLSYPTGAGFTSFDPSAPFADQPLQTGAAAWSLGGTVGLLSQDRGD
ncbi:MAG: hypothetical protein ACRD1Y_02360 [Terriglobales bacterium]